MTAVLDSLQQGRQAVQPALQAALQRLDPTSRALAYYHFGWTDLDGNPTSSGGGKAVRPALALLSAEAAGARPSTGLPGAVAVELVHNFSLLHDDLMDGDTERRHRPTVWAVRGAASAILTGDAMLSLAQEVLLEGDGPCTVAAARLLSEAVNELIRGQVLDLEFERRDDVTLDECLDMAAGKTGALLSASSAIGAVLAGAPQETVNALAGFGADLGLACFPAQCQGDSTSLRLRYRRRRCKRARPRSPSRPADRTHSGALPARASSSTRSPCLRI